MSLILAAKLLRIFTRTKEQRASGSQEEVSLHFKITGTAAGGGFPQWNCACNGCQAARTDQCHRRKHACAAFSADGVSWYLLNAPPDVAAQIECTRQLHPGPSIRQTGIRGVVLTDAELDHTIGLLVLREQSSLEIYATSTVIQALEESFPVRKMLADYANFSWNVIEPDKEFTPAGCKAPDGSSLIRIHPFVAGRKQPRYVSTPFGCREESADTAAVRAVSTDWVIGLRLEDVTSKRSLLYAPAIESLGDHLCHAISASDTIFVDGTFWSDDELSLHKISTRTARECGHVPLSGPHGLIEYLSEPGRKRPAYLVHVNNTNPLLVPNQHVASLPDWIALATEGMMIDEE